MEVKIKTKDFLVDATIEMVDGVMLVSPVGGNVEVEKEKFEPKNGDVIFVEDINLDKEKYWEYIIVDEWRGLTVKPHVVFDDDGTLRFDISLCIFGKNPKFRYASEVEKTTLFNRIEEEGYVWDAEKKEVRKKKWKPGVGELFYFPRWNGMSHAFYCMSFKYMSEETLEKNMDDWMFQTEEECKEICEKLNEKIKEVEP